jgi:hypothetical protein
VIRGDCSNGAFGKVIDGLEVVDGIVAQLRNLHDRPQRIKTVTVDTRGLKCPAPETIGRRGEVGAAGVRINKSDKFDKVGPNGC